VLRFRLMVNEVRVYGLKHQKEKRSMDHFAGLDVSVKETSVCVVDEGGADLATVLDRKCRH
jgi:transposase